MAKKTQSETVFDIRHLSGLTADSRTVKPGYLFAAFSGSKTDGTIYIQDAIDKGAAVLLVKTGAALPAHIPPDVAVIYDDYPRRQFAMMVAEFYGYAQPEHVAAVTGTNGKTSIAWFVRQIWQKLGYKAAGLGTLGLITGDQYLPESQESSATTPDPVKLHEELKTLDDTGVSHLAMEASSHGLDQYRMDGVRVETAAFTNLSHDHLDYHPDMQSYLQAKLRLFSELLLPDGVAVLNADVPEYGTIKGALSSGQRVISYGTRGEDIKLLSRTLTADGQDMDISLFGQDYHIHLPLIGQFQVMNVLCAIGMVLAHDKSKINAVLDIIPELSCVPGRLERIDGHPSGASVYVDYAHTPDALRSALEAIRPHVENRLVCLFGCGGDRDRTKRPVMGKIAAEIADVVYVTDDNPRSEDPAAIRQAIMQAAPSAHEVSDRAQAIVQSIGALGVGDCLLIAGKGHEQGQTIGDKTLPFDDRTHARESIAALLQGGAQ